MDLQKKNGPRPADPEWNAADFVDDRSGATVVEYALIVALIFVAIIGAVNNFAGSTNDMYSEISSALTE